MVFLSLIFSVVFVVMSYTGLCGESTVCYSHQKKKVFPSTLKFLNLFSDIENVVFTGIILHFSRQK